MDNFIPSESLSNIMATGRRVEKIASNSSYAQRHFSEMNALRKRIIETFSTPVDSNTNKCPLCGHQYDSHRDLLLEIKKQTEISERVSSQLASELTEAFNGFQKEVLNFIVKPILDHLKDTGLNSEIITKIKDKEVANNIIDLSERFDFRFFPKETIEETQEYIVKEIENIVNSLTPEIDIDKIQHFLSSYPLIQQIETLKVEDIENKRAYLILKMKEKSSKLLVEKNLELVFLNNKLEKCKSRDTGLTKLQNEIKKQRTEYLKKLISDIEILFYIYTGRILQDNYFGRGIFMKLNQDKSVLFVANDYDSDVDALYKMSSGQLSGIIIAFTLTLNKLYANYAFLAIDDPIQTMDDMNLWGLIETLRHEFKDYCLILSTHEPKSGGLLNYRARKLGISSYYYNMAEAHTADVNED